MRTLTAKWTASVTGALAVSLLAGSLLSAAAGEATAAGARPELGLGRSAEYDYDPPVPGSYTLPVLQPASDGTVLGTDGKPIRLHDLLEDRIVILSFIYTRCTDPRACLRATGVLNQLQRLSRQDPEIARKMILITLSFDPSFDTPEVMGRYGRVFHAGEGGTDWLFLTTRNQTDLEPLLEAYGQRVDKRKTPGTTGPYYHPLRVYLIDRERQVRNIYSFGLLDPRLVMTDVRTLILEEDSTQAASVMPLYRATSR